MKREADSILNEMIKFDILDVHSFFGRNNAFEKQLEERAELVKALKSGDKYEILLELADLFIVSVRASSLSFLDILFNSNKLFTVIDHFETTNKISIDEGLSNDGLLKILESDRDVSLEELAIFGIGYFGKYVFLDAILMKLKRTCLRIKFGYYSKEDK